MFIYGVGSKCFYGDVIVDRVNIDVEVVGYVFIVFDVKYVIFWYWYCLVVGIFIGCIVVFVRDIEVLIDLCFCDVV